MTELIKPPPFSRSEIVRRATKLSLGYAECVGHNKAMLGFNFDIIFKKFIYPTYGIELIEDRDLSTDEDGEKILGLFQPLSNRVFIDPCLRDDPRRVFTCWHEVGGHAILQGDWLRQEMKRLGREKGVPTTAPMISPEVENTLEWQANLFAANAAAPLGFVDYQIQKTFDLIRPLRYIGPGKYSFVLAKGTRNRSVEDYSQFCNCIAFYIRQWFGGLSVEALSYQVVLSKWVVDDTPKANPLSEFRLKRSTRPTRLRGTKKKVSGLSDLLTPVR